VVAFARWTAMQVVFYGYGTGWHWCYYLTLVGQTVACFSFLYGLRYRLSEWDAFPLVKVANFLMGFSIYVEVLLPIPGFLTKKMIHLVPFQSPTWTLMFLYVMVRHIPCGISVCACLQAFVSCVPDDAVDMMSFV
jgi:hypothetical protein